MNNKNFIDELINNSDIKNFWTKYNKFCKSINEIEFNIDHFILSLPNLFEILKNDLSSNEIYTAIKKFSSKYSDKGNYLFNVIIKCNNSKLISLLPSIIAGLSISNEDISITIKKVKLLLESNDIDLKRVGLISVMNIEISDDEIERNFMEYTSNQLEKILETEDESYFDIVTKVYGNLRTKLTNSNPKLVELSQKNLPNVQYELVNLLWQHIKIDNEYDLFNSIIFNLDRINPEYKAICKSLNYLLTDISKTNPKLVIDFIEKWLLFDENRAKEIGVFNNLFIELHRNNYSQFKILLTNWLNSDNLVFQKSLFEILKNFKLNNIKELEISEEELKKLEISDVKYIICKIIGFIYDKDLSASILYSILRIRLNDTKIVQLISSVYINYLIFNYHSLLEYLEDKKKAASNKEIKIINSIKAKSLNYYDKIYKLPLKNEFKPLENRLKYFNKIESKKHEKSFNESEKENSFASIFKTINYRVGKSTFSKYEGEYTDVMTPSLISHSVELPRGEFIDPIGQAKYRLIMQNIKRVK